MLDRDTQEGYGRRGWFRIEGSRYTRGPLGRETATVPHLCMDPDPYRTLPREGARHHRFPRLRLQTVEVEEAAGLTAGTFNYVDQRAFDESRAGLYPRGLVGVGEATQAGQLQVFIAGRPLAVTIVYKAATRTYRYYSGLPPELTQPSGAPPFSPTARLVRVDFGDLQTVITRGANGVFGSWYRGLIAAVNASVRFTWDVSKNGSFQGMYWSVDEQWASLLQQEAIEYPPMGGGVIGG